MTADSALYELVRAPTSDAGRTLAAGRLCMRAARRTFVVGQKFGRLTLVERIAGSRSVPARWRVRCDCGAEKMLCANNIGKTKSCGCYRIETSRQAIRKAVRANVTHGGAHTPEYRSWRSMVARCTNERHRSYPEYGGRGVTVCSAWMDFATFRRAVGARPLGTTLDRIDNARGYEPGNVRWATREQQNSNTRANRLITFRGRTMTAAAWARKVGISYAALLDRLKDGWSVRRALTEPSTPHRKRLLTFHGITRSVAEWARHLGMPYYRLLHRVTVLGWSTERALTEGSRA
ncbi:MAG: hypothetical protein AAB721_02915 [Patescibacteria group bacterium]